MAKINTVANNGLTIIENYNKLLEQIRKAKTIDDVRILVASTRDFISVYKRVDKNMVNEIYEKLQGKLHDMVAENAFVYCLLYTSHLLPVSEPLPQQTPETYDGNHKRLLRLCPVLPA